MMSRTTVITTERACHDREARKTLRSRRRVCNAEDLQETIDQLLNSAFHRAELSFLAGEHAANDKLDGHYASAAAVATIRLSREQPLHRFAT
jgi:hypothetical protein